MVFSSEKEAKEAIERRTKLSLSKFCPLIAAKCRPDCFCFMAGEIQHDGVNYRVPFVGCGNGMFG